MIRMTTDPIDPDVLRRELFDPAADADGVDLDPPGGGQFGGDHRFPAAGAQHQEGQGAVAALLAEGGPQGLAVMALGEGSNLWLIAVLLFFVTGPSEELYWRGYLQRGLSQRLGGFGGYVAATALYAAVHLWTLNVMLVGAAAVAGAFWGLLYWRLNNLAPVIISHSIWSALIFSGLRV